MGRFAGWCLVLPALLLAGGATAQDVGQPPPLGQQSTPHGQPSSPQTLRPPPQPGTSNGVIHPPQDVDPGMAKPAPNTGMMPVIPAPGQSGSAQPNVIPK
jgi:hypothetical protein